MSLEKGVKLGKEWRKPFYKSGRFDKTCRPHGGCPYCFGNRHHSHRKREQSCRESIREFVQAGRPEESGG